MWERIRPKTTYRVEMPEQAGGPLLFQAWAMIDNVSEESWDGVQLALSGRRAK